MSLATTQTQQHSNDALVQHVVEVVKSYLTKVNSKDSNLNLYQLLIEERQ